MSGDLKSRAVGFGGILGGGETFFHYGACGIVVPAEDNALLPICGARIPIAHEGSDIEIVIITVGIADVSGDGILIQNRAVISAADAVLGCGRFIPNASREGVAVDDFFGGGCGDITNDHVCVLHYVVEIGRAGEIPIVGTDQNALDSYGAMSSDPKITGGAVGVLVVAVDGCVLNVIVISRNGHCDGRCFRGAVYDGRERILSVFQIGDCILGVCHGSVFGQEVSYDAYGISLSVKEKQRVQFTDEDQVICIQQEAELSLRSRGS